MDSEEKTTFFFYQPLLQAEAAGTLALLCFTVACMIPVAMLMC